MQPSTFRAAAPLVLSTAALLLLSACDIQFAGQEMQARPNPDGSLDLLLIYRGISASKETDDSLRGALGIAHQFLEGRRRFAISVPFGEVDLDDPSTYKDLDEEAAQLLQSISLEESGVFLDPEGRLSAYQRVRVPDVACGLRVWNRMISSEVLSAVAEDGSLEGYGELDARSQALWIERARSGEPWVSFEGGLFTIDLPVTRATADRFQRMALDGLADKPSDSGELASLLTHLRFLQIGEERTVLSFGAPETGIFRLASEGCGDSYRPALREALEAEGVRADPDLTLEQVRGLLLR